MLCVIDERIGRLAASSSSMSGRQPIEGHGHVVDPLRQQLERVQIAARRLPAAVEDQDVIAQLLRLAENLRGQHDGPPAPPPRAAASP